SATKGGRLGIDKKGRMVRRLKTRGANEAAQLLLRHGKTRTEAAVGSAAISPSQYNKTTASDFTEETKVSIMELQALSHRHIFPVYDPTDAPSRLNSHPPSCWDKKADRRRRCEEKVKDRCGGTKVRHPQGQLAAGAPRRQTDGERSRGLAGQEPNVPRDRADSDSDGKVRDTGRLGLRKERKMAARGVKARSSSTWSGTSDGRRHPR
ncbi:hypothetical protein CF319_g2564, partial [Tilletia indica]